MTAKGEPVKNKEDLVELEAELAKQEDLAVR